MIEVNVVCLMGLRLRKTNVPCIKKRCLLLRDWSTKRCTYGITLLTSFSRASKRGALSSGIADLFMESGLLNALGATFFSELRATYEAQAPLD